MLRRVNDTYLDVIIASQFSLSSDFYMTDVQSVNEGLDSFFVTARSSSQSQHSKVRVLCHHVTNDLVVSIIARGTMGLV